MSGMEDRFTTKVRESRADWLSVLRLKGEVEALAKRYPAVAAHQLLRMVSKREVKARQDLRNLLNSESGELFGSATLKRGQAACSASSSHRGFLPRHRGSSAGAIG